MLKLITTLLTLLNYRPWYNDTLYTYSCLNTHNSVYSCIKQNIVNNKKDHYTLNLRGSKQIDIYFKNNSFDTEVFKVYATNFTQVQNICDKFKITCKLIS